MTEEQRDNPLYSDTAYDDAFRTMESRCDDLVIPFVNHMFGENYDSKAVIKRLRNEHFVEHENESSEKRITDSNFEIISEGKTKKYHLECEAQKYTGEILVRIFEYGTQIAKDEAAGDKYKRTFMFPNSGVLLLRKIKDAPEAATIGIILPDGREVAYQVPLVKMSDYDIDAIFSKRLYMLLPFYIFNYEKELEDINDNEEKLEKMFSVYEEIYDRLDNVLEQGNLSEISFHAIIRLIHKVAYNLSKKCEKVQKKVGDIMGGKVLDLPEFVAYDQAKAEGKAKGKAEERAKGINIFV
ncbi:MAG: hypothetical protein K5986_02595, partial [Clostridium sp.]|nr:hypothetical protein [Clostridium sp.]